MEEGLTPEEEKREVKRQIEAFFRFAGTPVPWNGEVNEGIAAVFGVMLSETAKCSDAMAWVPRPPNGPATMGYLAKQFRGALYRQVEDRMSPTCAKHVVNTYRTDFEMAKSGVFSFVARLPRWA